MKPKLNLAAFCGIIFLCASCSSVHKITTKSTSHVDSASSKHVDSTSVNKSTEEHEGIEINDLKVVVDYPDFPSEDTVKPGDSPLIKFIKRTHPKSVTITAKNITDTTSRVVSADSVRVIKSDTSKVVSNHTNNVRAIEKKGTSFGFKVGVIASIIVLLLFAYLKFNLKRFL